MWLLLLMNSYQKAFANVMWIRITIIHLWGKWTTVHLLFLLYNVDVAVYTQCIQFIIQFVHFPLICMYFIFVVLSSSRTLLRCCSVKGDSIYMDADMERAAVKIQKVGINSAWFHHICTDTDTAMDLYAETFILIGLYSDLRHSLQANG